MKSSPHKAYANGRRAKGQCEPVVYWIDATGEVMLAPHPEYPPFKGWVRHEAATVADIRRLSRTLREQEEARMRGMTIREHLRAQKKFDEQEARIKLHKAQGYASANDRWICERILANIERRRAILMQLLTDSSTEFLTGCLGIEKKEAPTGMAAFSATKKLELV